MRSISDLVTGSMNLSAWGNPTAKRIRVGSLCVTLALPITEKAVAELQKGNHGIRHQSKEYFTSPKIPEENSDLKVKPTIEIMTDFELAMSLWCPVVPIQRFLSFGDASSRWAGRDGGRKQ
jgi:hypothetical protein